MSTTVDIKKHSFDRNCIELYCIVLSLTVSAARKKLSIPDDKDKPYFVYLCALRTLELCVKVPTHQVPQGRNESCIEDERSINSQRESSQSAGKPEL